jgi:hypothetical protein
MLHQHHAHRAAFDRNAMFFQGREQNFFFLNVMTAIGKTANEIERFFPTIERLWDRPPDKTPHHGKHPFDYPVFITEERRRAVREMMSTSCGIQSFVPSMAQYRVFGFASSCHDYPSFSV